MLLKKLNLLLAGIKTLPPLPIIFLATLPVVLIFLCLPQWAGFQGQCLVPSACHELMCCFAHVREGLSEESLAIFDLLKKDNLNKEDIKRVKAVSQELLATLKAEKLTNDHWAEKESTRDAVRIAIKDYLWSDVSGLPVDSYDEEEVSQRADAVFGHVLYAYPTLPSPWYGAIV